MIPMRMRLEIRNTGDKRDVNLYLPLFLLWILLLPIIVLLGLVWLFLRIPALFAPDLRWISHLIEAGVSVLREIDDLHVETRSADSKVLLHF